MNLRFSQIVHIPERSPHITLSGHMALTSDAVFATNDSQVPKPSGYTAPTTAIEQTDPSTVKDAVYSMPKSDATSTTPTLGLDGLISAFETWLSGTFIPTTLGIDVTNTVTAIARIKKIVVGDDPADIYENDATGTFEITFDCDIEVS